MSRYSEFAGPGSQLGAALTDATLWIKGKLAEFYSVPNRISSAQGRASAIAALLAAKGDTANVSRLREATNQLATTQAQQTVVQDRVRDLLNAFGAVGVQLAAVVPLELTIQAAATATQIAGVLNDVQKQENAIADVAKAGLTPDEAARIGQPLPGPNLAPVKYGFWALLGLGGLYLFRRRRRGPR